MIDKGLARARAHRNNIDRYRLLLRTQLSDIERHFIERRLAEEQKAADELATLAFPYPGGTVQAIEPSQAPPRHYVNGDTLSTRESS